MLMCVNKSRHKTAVTKLYLFYVSVLFREFISHIHDSAFVLNKIFENIVILVYTQNISLITLHIKEPP